MNINFSLSSYPSFGGSIKCAVYAADNPGAEISSQTFAPPHTSPRAVSFTGLDRKIHIVKTIALPSTTIHDFIYNPMDNSYTVYEPIIHKIGDGQPNTPVAGTNTYRNNTALKKSTGVAKTFFVERRSVGTLRKTVEYTIVQTDPNYGFDLALAGDVWQDEEVIVIHILPEKLQTAVNDSVVGKWFDGALDITGASVAYITTHLKQLLRSRGSGALQTYNLPAAASAPIGYALAFSTYGSLYTSFKALSPTANIQSAGALVDNLTVGQNCVLIIMFDGTNWQIVEKISDIALSVSDNPDLDNSAILATTKATKVLADRIKFIATGKTNIGNVGSGDPQYSIAFANPNNYDYIVMGSWKSNSSGVNKVYDNAITWAWWKDETNPNTVFKIIVQELATETQNVEFCWTVLRI